MIHSFFTVPYISTNDSNYVNKYGGNWMILLKDRFYLTSRHLPIFEKNNQINSYLTEIYVP